jgi:cyanophycinase
VRRSERPTVSPKAAVILIGGAEEKEANGAILGEVARRAREAPVAVCTAGSEIPDELYECYRAAFRQHGVKSVLHIRVPNRRGAEEPKLAQAVADAQTFFFTGGDQLLITSRIGGSLLWSAIQELYRKGGTVAGTSAGASALGQTMPLSMEADEHKIAAAWQLLPALGLLRGVIVDQHFAQRGRMGRLIAAVVENPRLLGLGIDENTALIWSRGYFHVIGDGAVYVVDGRDVKESNLGGDRPHSAVSAFDLRLHVLSAGNRFDVESRRPILA